jgi:hypothetical protein
MATLSNREGLLPFWQLALFCQILGRSARGDRAVNLVDGFFGTSADVSLCNEKVRAWAGPLGRCWPGILLYWRASRGSGLVVGWDDCENRGRLERRVVAILGNLHWQYSADSWVGLRVAGNLSPRRRSKGTGGHGHGFSPILMVEMRMGAVRLRRPVAAARYRGFLILTIALEETTLLRLFVKRRRCYRSPWEKPHAG